MLFDNILGIVSIVAFALLFLSLIFAVLDVYFITPFLKYLKEKNKENSYDRGR